MTVEVRQGQTATLALELRSRAGALADADAGTLVLTLAELDETVVDGFPIAQAGLTHLGTGLYRYLWSVPLDQEAGTLLAEWDGYVAGEQIDTATEDVFVLPAEVPSTYLTVDQLREHVKSALPDAALQRLLDANSLAIDERAGPIGTETLVLYPARQTLLFLDRPIGTITSLTEFFNDPVGISGVVLDSTDYRLQSAGTILERWGYGSHPADWWSDRVELVYLPVDDTAERIRVLIKLVELDLNRQPGLSGVRMGEYAEQQRGEAYDDEREAILASLVPNALTFA